MLTPWTLLSGMLLIICTWFCCDLFCYGCIKSSSQMYLCISFRVASLALGLSYDYPSASEVTLNSMVKFHQHQTTIKYNKAQTVSKMYQLKMVIKVWIEPSLQFEVLLFTLQWHHNERVGISNHQSPDCLLNRLFRPRSKKASKLRITGLCAGNLPMTGELPAQRASNVEKGPIVMQSDTILTLY